MKQLIFIFAAAWLVIGISLCVKSVPKEPLIDTGKPIVKIVPDKCVLELKQEAKELEYEDGQYLIKYPLLYDVPLEGKLQHYIAFLCEQNDIDIELVLAIIDVESNYTPTAISGDGSAVGLMQIIPWCHSDRIQRLGVTDVLDPYQNVEVGIDCLAYLFRAHGKENVSYVLMCYNQGEGGAASSLAQGITETYYSQTVLKAKERIHAVKLNNDSQITDSDK